jgi:hypothetical protein
MLVEVARSPRDRPDPGLRRLWKVLHERQGLPVAGVGEGMSVW